MTFFRRAWHYVTHKWMRMLLLFGILFFLTTLCLSGLAIRSGLETAQLNVRQALGGVFTLTQNMDDPDKWVEEEIPGYGTQAYYGGTPLSLNLAEKIAGAVSGIRGYNASYLSYTVPLGMNGEPLTLIEGDEEKSWLDSMIANTGDMAQTVSTYASTDSAFDSNFAGGYLKLVEGKPIQGETAHEVLMSQALAEKNGLAVGDTLTLRTSEQSAGMRGLNMDDTKVSVKIVGLFAPTAKSTATLSNWSMDNAIFTTMDVLKIARPDIGDEQYEKINFYVDDPAEVETIVDQVQHLDGVDSSDFIVSADTSAVDAVMKPLNNVDRLVTVLILLVLSGGAVVLYLVLASRIKERNRESGILLSLGFSKRSIVLQYLTEILLVALLAFPCATLAAGGVAQVAGEQLLAYATTEKQHTDQSVPGIHGDGNTIVNSSDFAPKFEEASHLTNIDLTVSWSNVCIVFGIGVVIIIGAVLLAALPVFRLQPREITAALS